MILVFAADMRHGAALSLALALAIAGGAIHVYALSIDAGGARLIGLVPYVLAAAVLKITRIPVAALSSVVPLLMVDGWFAFHVLQGSSGGFGGLGTGWAMAHYVKMLVLFPICTWLGIKAGEASRDPRSS